MSFEFTYEYKIGNALAAEIECRGTFERDGNITVEVYDLVKCEFVQAPKVEQKFIAIWLWEARNDRMQDEWREAQSGFYGHDRALAAAE